MPIRRLLDESGSFDPNAIAVLAGVFNSVVSELAIEAPAERARAAKGVIRLAHGRTDLDAAKLRAAAVAELGSLERDTLHGRPACGGYWGRGLTQAPSRARQSAHWHEFGERPIVPGRAIHQAVASGGKLGSGSGPQSKVAARSGFDRCVASPLEAGIVAKDHVQQGIVDRKFPVVVDEAKLAELVHKKTHA
jgi:hypothetical protein